MHDAKGKALELRLEFPDGLPEMPEFEPGIRRAPNRGQVLNDKEVVLALKNALRYIPEKYHKELAPEFLKEYQEHGRIYGYRFRPKGKLYGKPIDEYKGKCIEGKAFQVMIDNNLDFDVALYPYELVTYGETGQVCQNWMQYLLIKKGCSTSLLKSISKSSRRTRRSSFSRAIRSASSVRIPPRRA